MGFFEKLYDGASKHRVIHMNFLFIMERKQKHILSIVCLKSFLQMLSLRICPVRRSCFMDFYLTGCSYP